MFKKIFILLLTSVALASCTTSKSKGKGGGNAGIQTGNPISVEEFISWANSLPYDKYSKLTFTAKATLTDFYGKSQSGSLKQNGVYLTNQSRPGFYYYDEDENYYSEFPYVFAKNAILEWSKISSDYSIECFDNHVFKIGQSESYAATEDYAEEVADLYYPGLTLYYERTLFYRFDDDGYVTKITDKQFTTLKYPKEAKMKDKTASEDAEGIYTYSK